MRRAVGWIAAVMRGDCDKTRPRSPPGGRWERSAVDRASLSSLWLATGESGMRQRSMGVPVQLCGVAGHKIRLSGLGRLAEALRESGDGKSNGLDIVTS